MLAQAAAGVVVAVSPQSATARAGVGINPSHTTVDVIPLSQLELRGYGTLSAIFRRVQFGSGSASVLQISCESTAKALLMQAKYLSDTKSLPGVKLTETSMAGSSRIYLTLDGGSSIAAVVADKLLVVLAAASQTDLVELAAQYVPVGTPATAFLARVEVPMYLDRFDKHGLLCYYEPFHEPPGPAIPGAPYDYGKDFDFAAQNNVGLVFWDNETPNDMAEGLANLASWRWAAQEARARRLPIHINTSFGPALWLTNRFRGETMQKQTQYCGSYHRIGASDLTAVGTISWAAEEGQDAELGVLQATVRRFVDCPNVVGWLEPHGEADFPPLSLLVEYSTTADRSFRRYLRTRYTSPAILSKAWFDDVETVKSWEQVRVPEVASFLGWGEDALDLTGEWKMKFASAPDGHAYTREEARSFGTKPIPTAAVPTEWYQPGFDDRTWGSIKLPGNDRQMYMVGAPAVVRRKINVPPLWLERYPRQWLYLWDLSDGVGERYPIFVNGQAGELSGSGPAHWGVAELTGILKAGSNLIALLLPKGFLGYRCYIAATPPLQYPALGAQLNARWSDFVGWSRVARGDAIRRGAEMIRQVDAERPINFMHPDAYLDLVGQVCADVGGHFHNTGYMAGFWSEYNPIVARGAGRPATAEPGSAAVTARDFQAFWGRWLTEGIQSVHYFQHLGDIMWNPSVRQVFADNRTLYETIGKYHVPRAEVAILYGLRSNALMSWPWGLDPNTNMPGGYWTFNTAYCLLGLCPRDGVTEESFENGTVTKYRVIIDSNTSIMTEAMVGKIEDYVCAGGTFVTFGQTGRHTPTMQGAWPIAALTGYAVLRIDRYGNGNWPKESHTVRLAPGQSVFQTKPWDGGVHASGLSLRRVAPEAQDLLLWEDGSVAAGLRPLGSGRVIHLGLMFEALGDRTASPLLQALLGQIVDHLKVAPVPARARDVMLRHYISNNGLFDLWMIFNEADHATTTDLTFIGPHPQAIFETKTGLSTTVTSRDGIPGIFGLKLGPMETRLLQSPRMPFENAPLEWLRVQRDWWAGTQATPSKRLPTPVQDQRHSVDLTDDWAFQDIDGLGDVAIPKLAASETDDAQWERRPLGIWGLPDHANVQRAMWRKRISVPADWQGGETQLWLRSWFSTTFHDRARVFVDGRLFREFSADGMAGIDVTQSFPPGSSHVIALDISGSGKLRGVDGSAWLYHIPDPVTKLDLSGKWTTTVDGVHDGAVVALPGTFNALFATRNLEIDNAQSHRNAVIYIRTDGPVLGVLINGFMIGRHPHMIGQTFCIDITPKAKFGASNRIELVTHDVHQQCRVQTVELRFYDRGVYP
jgi:hypothetical protein